MKHTYSKANIESTISAASKTVANTNEVRYVFATCNGFIISKTPRPFNDPCYKITAAGTEKAGDWRTSEERYALTNS